MIKFQFLTFNPFSTNCWLAYNEKNECLIFDPGMYDATECQEFENLLHRLGLKPTALINTHAHLDHIFGNHFILEKYGIRPLLHIDEQHFLENLSQLAAAYGLAATPSPEPLGNIEAGELDIMGFHMKVLHTPGHSPGSLSFYFEDAKAVISGDVLFRESIGRTDLPGGDHTTLMRSIAEKLYDLPDDTAVHNGHGPSTTIGHEKQHNPFIRS